MREHLVAELDLGGLFGDFRFGFRGLDGSNGLGLGNLFCCYAELLFFDDRLRDWQSRGRGKC